MIEYFYNNMHSFWFVIGFLLLVIEALALGFSSGFVLFVGLGALVTGGLLWAGLIPATWLASIASFGLFSALISAALWKPFMAIQRHSKPPEKDNSSDLVGLKFRLEHGVTTTLPGATRFSGIEWKVEIDYSSDLTEIPAGTTVMVVSVDAGRFKVVPAES